MANENINGPMTELPSAPADVSKNPAAETAEPPLEPNATPQPGQHPKTSESLQVTAVIALTPPTNANNNRMTVTATDLSGRPIYDATVTSTVTTALDEYGHPQKMWIMSIVWLVTALYFDMVGLSAYYAIGRKSSKDAYDPDKSKKPYWLMMQIGMVIGYGTSYPMNWWLLRRGIKEEM